MADLKILIFPDPRLRTVAKTVENIDGKIKKLVNDMQETMYKGNGIGLSATQVNIHKRILLVDISKEKNSPLVLINPIIEPVDKEKTSQYLIDYYNPYSYAKIRNHQLQFGLIQ